MLTDGFNHVAVITKDADRLLEFYAGVFDAVKAVEMFDGPPDEPEHKLRLMIIDVGPHSELNVFEMSPARSTRPARRARASCPERHAASLGRSNSPRRTPRRRRFRRVASKAVGFGRRMYTWDGNAGFSARSRSSGRWSPRWSAGSPGPVTR